jgi:hypothetical protein
MPPMCSAPLTGPAGSPLAARRTSSYLAYQLAGDIVETVVKGGQIAYRR